MSDENISYTKYTALIESEHNSPVPTSAIIDLLDDGYELVDAESRYTGANYGGETPQNTHYRLRFEKRARERD